MTKATRIALAAGGTGGHVFPALSVALELRKQNSDIELLWVGTNRYREKELCDEHGIRLRILNVRGVARTLSAGSLMAVATFLAAALRIRSQFRRERPDAVIAFGGYVCAPVLAAARLAAIPYFLQEQNTVPGLVNRMFARKAVCTFLGFPIVGKWRLNGTTCLTRTPVRSVAGTFSDSAYPTGFDRARPTVLICGGSQGAVSMNKCLVPVVKKLLAEGIQVIWQTGTASYEEMRAEVAGSKGAFVLDLVPDLYPYYAAARAVVGRSGSSTINELAYFGIPCVLIPLPWSAENHQWWNAGLVEEQGWGIRVAQGDQCAKAVLNGVLGIVREPGRHEKMSRRALDNTPVAAASEIARQVLAYLER